MGFWAFLQEHSKWIIKEVKRGGSLKWGDNIKTHDDLHAFLVFAQVEAPLRQREALLINLHTHKLIH